jgi:hypothetical protein
MRRPSMNTKSALSAVATGMKIRREIRLGSAEALDAFALALVLSISISPAANAVEFSDWCPRINLGPVVNSPFSDGGPAISRDGLSLYLHSNRTGNFDIYVSQRLRVDAPWAAPENLGPTINTPLVESVPALSPDGHWLFFNSLNRPGGFGGFDIWASFRRNVHDDFAWEPPVNLGPGVNSTFTDGGASYFENDDFGLPLLFFSSNRPGGPGRVDIYVSAQQLDGSFGPAELVGELNTPAIEGRPAIRFDGLELFLTRDVDPLVINDNDIWVSTRKALSDPWSPPVKLGSTVNSELDDVRAYIAADRETLFFESGPNEPFGDLDVYVTTRSRNGECD